MPIPVAEEVQSLLVACHGAHTCRVVKVSGITVEPRWAQGVNGRLQGQQSQGPHPWWLSESTNE